MICELCGKEGSYRFHENVPPYCPNYKQYLHKNRVDKTVTRNLKINKILNKIYKKKRIKLWQL